MKTGKITLQNLTAGWSKDFTAGNASRSVGNNGYTRGFGVHFSRPGYLGDMSSSPLWTLEENAQNHGYFFSGLTASNGVTYLVTSKGYVYIKNGGSLTFLTNIPFGIETNLTGVWLHMNQNGEECLFFTTISSTPKWSLLYAKISDLETVTPPASVATTLLQDIACTTAELAYFRKGIVGPANKSYILNGGYVSTYDPVTNVVSVTALLLGKGWVVTSLTNYGNYIAIVGNRGTGQSRLWLWDGSSQNVNYSYDIRDFYASCVINDGGTLYIFTKGKNKTTKLRVFTGNDIAQAPVFEYPTDTIGNPPNQDSIDFYFNQIFWFNENGQLYSFGSPVPSLFVGGLHNVSVITDTGNGGGICKNLQNDKLFLGIKDPSNTKIQLVSTDLTNSTASQLSNGVFVSKMYELPHKSKIEGIEVHFSDFSSTYSSFKIELFKERDSATDLLQVDTITGSTAPLYYYNVGKSVPQVDTFYIKITMSNCSIRKIDIEYTNEDGLV